VAKKLQEQININPSGEICQSPDGGSSVEQVKKRMSSCAIVEEDQRPRKCRRLEPEKSVQPVDEQLENSTIMKAPEVSSLTQNVENVVEVKSCFPQVEKVRISSITNRMSNNNGIKEEAIQLLDSPDLVTSSVQDRSPQRQEERQKPFTSYCSDAVPSSSVNAETTPEALCSIPVDVSVKSTEDNQPKKSIQSSYIHEVDIPVLDEPQRSKLSVHFPHVMFSDENENNSALPTVNHLSGDKETGHTYNNTENCADKICVPVHHTAMEGKLSGKRTSVNEVGETGLDSTFTKVSENAQSNDICAKVLNVDEVHQSCKPNDSVLEQQFVPHSRLALQSSRSKNVVKPQKSTQIFRYAI
jgi:hypothetical protein